MEMERLKSLLKMENASYFNFTVDIKTVYAEEYQAYYESAHKMLQQLREDMIPIETGIENVTLIPKEQIESITISKYKS